jgi:hypothetical protein
VAPQYILQFRAGTCLDHLFQWLRTIALNRQRYGEDVDNLDINDIRNGILAFSGIHSAFDVRDVAVIKVCQIYLLLLIV